jgi:hypothetical protein
MTAKKTSKVINMMFKARHYLPTWSLNLLHEALIQSRILYASNIFGFTYDSHILRLSRIQNRAAKTILFKRRDTSSLPLLNQLKWLTIQNLIYFRSCIFVFKSINGFLCSASNNFFQHVIRRTTKSKNLCHLNVPKYKLQYCCNSLFFKRVQLWNSLDLKLQTIKKFKRFKKQLFNHFFNAQNESNLWFY